MSSFRTQVVSENPSVLLLGEYLPFLEEIQESFQEHQIETWLLSKKELSHLDIDSFDNKNIYKIIWWVDFSQEKALKNIQNLLKKVSNIPIVIVGVLPEKFTFLFEEKNELNSEKYLTSILEDFPQAQLFLIRDFFAPDFIPVILKTALQGFEKNVLFDPEKEAFYTDLKGVVETIRTSLFKPHTNQKVIIQGKTALSTKSLDYFTKIFLTYYKENLEVIPIEAERSSIDLSSFLTVKISSNIKENIDLFIQNKDQWVKKITKLPHSISEKVLQEVSIKSESINSKKNEIKKQETSVTKNTANSSLEMEKQSLISSNDESITDANKEIELKEDKKPIYQSKNLEKQKENQVEGELSRLFKEKRTNKKAKRMYEKVKIVKKISEKSKKNKILFFGGVGVMILGGITLALWIILETTLFFAKKDFLQYFSKNTPQNYTQYKTGFWPDSLDKQISGYENLQGEVVSEKTIISSLFQDFEQLQLSQVEFENKIKQYALGILGNGDTVSTFPQEIVDISQSIESQISAVEEALFYLYPEETVEQKKWSSFLETYRKRIALTQKLPSFLTDIFGGNGKKTYAVLLQNNLEIRPTGGFIQGFVLLTFDKGLLIDSQVFNTNEVDSRLPGVVESPVELQKYLGEKNWFMRDSNWDPDFPTTSKRVAWFIKESLKKQVDGVFAINYLVLQDLIKAMNNLEIPEYQEILTKENLLERVEFHSDDEFVQNDSSKKDYSFVIYIQLFQALKTLNPDEAGELVESLMTGLEKKNILLTVFDENNSKILKELGWDGEVISPVCPQRFPQTNCIVNQIYQTEANIGLNRVNEYIHRDIQERIDFTGKNIKHVRTVVYKNTAKSDGWPLGSYKMYIRFISGKNTQPKEVLVDGKKIDGGLASVYIDKERKVVGIPVEVPKDSTVTVQYTYETEKVSDEPFSFLLFDQKQPGIERDQLKTTLYFPGKKPTLIAPQGELVGDTLEFISSEDNHYFVGVSLQSR